MAIRSVESRCPARVAEAAELAVTAGAAHTDDPIVPDEYRIVLFEDREELWDIHTRRHGMPLSFRALDRRVGAGNLSHKQPIGKAIGPKAKSVIDATAGFGHDASLLACMGWRVTAIERDAFLAAAARLSLQDAARCEDLRVMLEGRLSVRHGDATAMLPGMAADVVYLDPMFVGRRKRSALPKKPAQTLQALVDVGGDDSLLAAARACADRVVVKRPIDGPLLAEPNLVFKGRLVRYDVYLGGGR
jgi:16S rRNA (guanine1516-N2)-methyltransferase